MRTHIDNYGRELQKKIANYPNRLMRAQNLAKTPSFTNAPLDEHDPNIYRQLKSFRDVELANRKVIVRAAISVYEQLRDEVEADAVALSKLIAEAPEGTSEERLNSLRISSNQLAQHAATISTQIELLENQLQTIMQSKEMIDDAMKQQRVASLLQIIKELNSQVLIIREGES